MRTRASTVRAHGALGRLWILLLALPATMAGCTPAGPRAAPPRKPPTPPALVVAPGGASPGEEAEAATLLRTARGELQAGQAAAARRTADSVVTTYPTTASSGPALLLASRAALASGAFAAADSAATRYVALLSPGDPRVGSAALVRAQAQDSLGNGVAALTSLLDVGAGSPADVIQQAVSMGRTVAAELGEQTLAPIVSGLPPGAPVAPVVSARYAILLQSRGAEVQAQRYAQLAIQGGAVGSDSVAASAILRGESPPGATVSALRLGLVLPETGPPTIRSVGSLIAEGVQVAVAEAANQGVQVDLDTRDDQGDPTVADSVAQALQNEGAVGALGFLEGPSLVAAAGGRIRPFALISPTARLGATAPAGAYSLGSGDPEAAVEIARYAAAAGIQRVAIIHSRAPESVAEAEAFTTAADSLGLPIVGDFAYDVGATSFGPQILGAADSLRAQEIAALHLGPDDTLHADQLTPVAVFLPVPREDIEYLAPEVTFYGLDTLAIQVLGTDGWTDPGVLASVDQRHTDGVVATAPVDGGPGSPGYAHFRAAYEAHFRRSLVSPIPALGYDAARLVLSTIERGARTPEQVQEALARIHDFHGATGILSVENGQIVRRTEVVRLDHGTFTPIG